jgi:hypothetical protein
MEDTMTESTPPRLEVTEERAIVERVKQEQARLADTPPPRETALAELAPATAQAEAALAAARQVADEIRPRVAEIAAQHRGLPEGPGPAGRALMVARRTLATVSSLLEDMARDPARLAAIRRRPFDGYLPFAIRDARAELATIADRPRVLRAALDEAERYHAALLQRLVHHQPAPPLPTAPAPDLHPPHVKQTHARTASAA